MGSVIVYLSISLCLSFSFLLIKLFIKLCWIPIRIQALMRSQGIKGPSYRFVYGNTKEIINMTNEMLASPISGLSHDTLPRIQPHIYSWIKLYGMNFINWYGPQAQLVVTEHELIKEILSNKDGTYPKTDVKSFVKKLLGDGLVTSQGEKWFKLRKLANHTFHAESLKDMIPAMIESVEMMLKKWRHYVGKEIEVVEEFKLLTSEVIAKTAFGSSYLEGENIFNMLAMMGIIVSRNNYTIKIPLIGKLLKTSDDVESDKLEQGIRDSVIKMIKKRENNYGNDFLGSLVKAYHDDDKTNKLSIDDVIDECKTFYIAGYETTASLLNWVILLLAIHTDWQEKLRNEVLGLFGQQNPKPDSIGKLKLMSMVINETLRLYTPVVAITRKVGREVRLGKLILPAKMDVYIPILALHQNPQIWGEDAHLFKPERFAEGVAKATNNNPTSFLPFGLGPRTCVGLNFATTEAKIALSMILQRYKFNLSQTYVHSPVQLLAIRPEHGLQIMLHSL